MMWLSGWLSLKELCQSEWRRETTVGRWSGWVVELSRVISERVRHRYIRVGRWNGWVVELSRVISEWVRERDHSLELKWLSGWAFKSDLRVSVGERPQSGDQAVEWLSFWEWYQRRRGTTVWALPISSRKLWLGGWPFKSDLGDTERGEQHKNSEEFMWLSG